MKVVITGGAGLHFKGSGFYITDYKKSSGGDETPKQDAPAAKKEKDAKPGASDSTTKKPSKGD